MRRRIAAVIAGDRIIDDGDMRLFRALPTEALDALGPFVFIDHYRSRSARGIGDRPHPHAGIEVISYLLEGGVQHRDSMGFRDAIGPGDAQWIRAGRGILHAEQPTGPRHGLQLWTSLPPDQKFAEPAYASWRAGDLPRLTFEGAAAVVLAGSAGGVEGPMRLATPTTFIHVRFDADVAVDLPLDPADELGVYVLEGSVRIDGGDTLEVGALAVLTPGETLHCATSESAAQIAILGGQTAARPILFGGPFVMDSVERLAQARADYIAGRMGRLEGVPF